MPQKTAKARYTPSRSKPARSQDGGRNGSRQTIALVVGVVLVFAIGVLVGLGVDTSGTSDSDRAVAEMQKADARRDVAQITALTTTARSTKDALTPVVAGLAIALPGDGTDSRPATDAQLSEWTKIMVQERQRYEETVSGSTGTNIARNALRSSVSMLATALDTYSMSGDLPEEQRSSLIEIAARQRLLAIATWSVAATQLDQLNIDAGNGHQHVYLTDTSTDGAMVGDGFPEGPQN